MYFNDRILHSAVSKIVLEKINIENVKFNVKRGSRVEQLASGNAIPKQPSAVMKIMFVYLYVCV